MSAIVYDRYGPPEVLHLVDLDNPEPGPGQIRVRVHAAGVNPVDAKQRRGDFAAIAPAHFPQRLGNEYAGTVDAIAPDVTSHQIGDAVLGSATACAYADYVITYAADAVRKPDVMDWTEAATLPAAGQTAAAALATLNVTAGDTLLIHGAAGGVGSIATQLAHNLGATVIGTASPANHDHLSSLGAIPITYGPGLIDRARDVARRGIDAALDLVGGDAITDSLTLVANRDRIGTTVDANAAATNGIHRVGGRSTAALLSLIEQYEWGRLRLLVEQSFPLADAAAAHHRIESGHGRGKLVLLIAAPSPE